MKSLNLTAAAFASVLSLSAHAAEPLVSVDWVKSNLDNTDVVFLDVRGKLAGKSRSDYEKAHIPGSVYTAYLKDGWRTKDVNGIPGQLPSIDKLEALIGGLGIGNSDHVVIIPQGSKALDVATGTRIYWTFKLLGHDKVSLLNGGFSAYAKIDKATGKPANPVETGANQPDAKIFEADLQTDYVISKADVAKALKNGTKLVDHRPNPQYLGLAKHGAATRYGTLPGAVNLPENWLTVNGGGTFRSTDQIKKLAAVANVGTDEAQINFCNTGHWASLGWFTAHELLGNKKAKLYDGSMVEWTADKSLPVEQKIILN